MAPFITRSGNKGLIHLGTHSPIRQYIFRVFVVGLSMLHFVNPSWCIFDKGFGFFLTQDTQKLLQKKAIQSTYTI